MNRILALFCVGLWSLCIAQGCCFIPVPRTTVTRPALEVTIKDMTTQQPLPGATVRISRIQEAPHYGTLKGEWELTADAQGVARSKAEDEREWIMPLMMHGVPFYMWRVCVAHDGYMTEFHRVHDKDAQDMASEPLTVNLKPGQSEPCPVRSAEPHIRQGKPGQPNRQEKNPIIEVHHAP